MRNCGPLSEGVSTRSMRALTLRLRVLIVPVKPCSWRDRFRETYGNAFAKGDVAFVTTDGAVARGMDKLNFDAQKTQVPDIVLVKGNTNRIQEILCDQRC